MQTQKELVQRAKTNSRLNEFRKDPEWARGLIETSEQVVSTNSYFVATINRVANADVRNLPIDELIKAATMVAKVNQKLVASSKAKSDGRSVALKKLTSAGDSVTAATKQLAEAAKHAAEMARRQEAMASKEPYDFEKRVE
eukprot:TRINITY_DN1769_c0_g3_i2.p2 TRINITY_DN1769_c0_g3~~TRINITY_DN1769_c0_g3_i2.p2  ORF type:complete len:162 (-),score=13.41 TRINITY_DN1769_c0_g3_i2:573-995(-)